MIFECSVIIEGAEESEELKIIRQGVIDFNRPYFGSQKIETFTIYIKDAHSQIIGGINGIVALEGHFARADWVWVHPEYRNQGIGSRLFQELETYVIGKGSKLIKLDTFDFQAREFYEKLGFQCVGTISQWTEGRDCHFMKKKL